MGEAAEDRLDGTVCEACGEYFDDVISGAEPPGFPRYCAACKAPKPQQRSPQRKFGRSGSKGKAK